MFKTRTELAVFLTAVVVASLMMLMGCSGRGPTAPEQVTTSTHPGADALPTATPSPPATEPDTEKVASINRKGTVTITKRRFWHACVYSTAQVLQHQYGVEQGSNPFQPGDLCGETTLQIDVQEGAQCPADGNGSFAGFKAGRIVSLDLDECPPPCQDVTRVLIKADTHVNGTFLYEVRQADGTVIWSKEMERGTRASFTWPPTGEALQLFLRLRPGRWEHDQHIRTTCSEARASWNERLSFSCSRECDE